MKYFNEHLINVCMFYMLAGLLLRRNWVLKLFCLRCCFACKKIAVVPVLCFYFCLEKKLKLVHTLYCIHVFVMCCILSFFFRVLKKWCLKIIIERSSQSFELLKLFKPIWNQKGFSFFVLWCPLVDIVFEIFLVFSSRFTNVQVET